MGAGCNDNYFEKEALLVMHALISKKEIDTLLSRSANG